MELMASTGTQAFNPTSGDLGLYALSRCGIKRTEVEASHLADMAMAANLVLSDMATMEPNLWKVTLLSTPLVQGTVQYTMPRNALIILNAYIRTTNAGFNSDRIIYGVSRDEYSSYPNKALQAQPTVYWANRTVPIVLNLYPAPDARGPYTLFAYIVQQDDDSLLAGASTLDLPFRFLKAFSDGLCAELALTYAPERAKDLYIVYQGADGRGGSKDRALVQDRENVPLYITPALGRYYRG